MSCITVSDDRLHKILATLVPEGSKVLDLGCGDGALLNYLATHKKCTGYGIEISDYNVQACIQRGVNVIQLNLEAGLAMFTDQSFDVVLQIDTLQNLRNTEIVLQETVRVGKSGVVAFPNFAHWPNRLSVLSGRMPVTRRLPYQWHDTPNIRVGTHADLLWLAITNQFNILDHFGVDNGRVIRWMPNLRASTSVLKISRHGS
jgi:methionine biosynthesis protein MetW